jgi:hypothetical protein
MKNLIRTNNKRNYHYDPQDLSDYREPIVLIFYHNGEEEIVRYIIATYEGGRYLDNFTSQLPYFTSYDLEILELTTYAKLKEREEYYIDLILADSFELFCEEKGVNLKAHNPKIFVIKGGNVQEFASLTATANFLGISESKVHRYLNSGKEINGYC